MRFPNSEEHLGLQISYLKNKNDESECNMTFKIIIICTGRRYMSSTLTALKRVTSLEVDRTHHSLETE